MLCTVVTRIGQITIKIEPITIDEVKSNTKMAKPKITLMKKAITKDVLKTVANNFDQLVPTERDNNIPVTILVKK